MTPRARFWSTEKTYWLEMPLAPFLWMCVLVLVSVCVNPLLPFVAYALHLWASSSWNWRDRWATMRTLTTPGVLFVCSMLILVALNQAQFWIVPALVRSAQGIWQEHLPGDLSLSPLDLHALAARLVFLLPLAPGLTLLYEYIAPRTRTQPRRILLHSDLVAPSIASSAQAPAQNPEPTASTPPPVQPMAPAQKAAPTPPKKQQQPLHRKQQQPGAQAGTVEQMTIDSFLAPDPPTMSGQKPTETKAAQQPPQPEKPIDWDNVLE